MPLFPSPWRALGGSILGILVCLAASSAADGGGAMVQPEDCMQRAGFFYDVSSSAVAQCSPCPPGYFCALGTAAMQPCAPGTFQPLGQKGTCLECPRDTECPSPGMSAYLDCPEGRSTTPPGSASCSAACDYERFFLRDGQCVARTRLCNFDAEYQVRDAANFTKEHECRALTRCDTRRFDDPVSPVAGLHAGIEKIRPLREYIATYHTRYTDRVCWAWAPCGEDDYALQLPVDDGEGFLLRPLVCRPLSAGPSSPTKNQYKLVDGSVTRDRDNVWVDCTRCVLSSEYEALPCTADRDAVCRARTICDPLLQYVERLGDATHDTVCARRTRCTAYTQRGMYELRPAVDSVSFSVNGTDAVCSPYSRCPAGSFASFSGSETSDVACTLCPPGTFRASPDDPERCTPCASGTDYASEAGSLMCLPCTRCQDLDVSDSLLEAYPGRCLAAQDCTVAAIEACAADRDARCAPCASSLNNRGGGFDVREGVCVPCRPGFFYNASAEPYAARCVACPEGSYCPSSNEVRTCEGQIRLARAVAMDQQNRLETMLLPWSPERSTRAGQCNCSLPGGFELAPNPSARGLGEWCVPCAAGKYAAPGGVMHKCEPCPAGTFAHASRVWWDAGKCSEQSILDATCSVPMVASGAVECTPCPLDRPYTWPSSSSSGAKSEDECHACPPDHYYRPQDGCRPCTPASSCQKPALFELMPCTENGNRECASCRLDSCHPVLEYLDVQRACPGPIHLDRPCAPCTDDMKPGEHSFFVDSGGSYTDGTKKPCAWKCEEGYYSPPGSEMCIPCTELTPQNCGPGFVQRPCSSVADASCAEACDPVALGKPPGGDTESEWIWTVYDENATLIPAPVAGEKPNAGCLWRCKQGYALRHMAVGAGEDGEASLLAFCVAAEA